MGTLAIIVCGFIGATSAARRNFVQSWIFLVNLSFSLYLAIFLAPLVIPLLDIPKLPAGGKNAIALGLLFLVVEFILKKITEQIVANPEAAIQVPALAAKIISLFSGFFSGALIAALILFCIAQTLPAIDANFHKNCQEASGKTFLVLVQTMNTLSARGGDAAKIPELRTLNIIPGDSKAPAAADKSDKTEAAAKAGNSSSAEPGGKPAAGPKPKEAQSKKKRQRS